MLMLELNPFESFPLTLPTPSPLPPKKLLKFYIADLHFLVALLNFMIFICALKQQYKEAE